MKRNVCTNATVLSQEETSSRTRWGDMIHVNAVHNFSMIPVILFSVVFIMPLVWAMRGMAWAIRFIDVVTAGGLTVISCVSRKRAEAPTIAGWVRRAAAFI